MSVAVLLPISWDAINSWHLVQVPPSDVSISAVFGIERLNPTFAAQQQ